MPTGFTALNGTNTTFAVATDAGSEGGRSLTLTKSGAARTRLAWDQHDGTSAPDVLMRFESSVTGSMGISFQSSGASGSENEYAFVVSSGTQIQLIKASSGSYTQVGFNASGLSGGFSVDTEYWMRVRYVGGRILARAWAASAVEPAAWGIDYTDGSPITSGEVCVYNNNTSGVLTVHALSLGLSGDCGCILADADLPATGVYVANQTESGLRVMDEDGADEAVVAILGEGSTQNLQGVAVHQANETVFVCLRGTGSVVRVDRYGLNRATINNTISAPFGIAIDEATDTLYIIDRTAKACYTDDIAGGSQATLFTTSGNLGYISFDGTYIWYTDSAVIYRRDADGTNATSYGSLTNPLAAISDGTTMVGGWFQTNTGVRSKPVASPGDSFTSVDTVTIQALTLNADGTETWGSEVNSDAVYHWTDYPPTTANRSTISTTDAPKGLAWFSFSAIASADGTATISDEVSGYATGAKSAAGQATLSGEVVGYVITSTSRSGAGYISDEVAVFAAGAKVVQADGTAYISDEITGCATGSKQANGFAYISDEVSGSVVTATIRSGVAYISDEVVGYVTGENAIKPSSIVLSIAHLNKIGISAAHVNKVVFSITPVNKITITISEVS